VTRDTAVLFKIPLVVLFCAPEVGRRLNLRHDRLLIMALLAFARRRRLRELLGRMRKDCRTVLIANVRSLAIELRRIVNFPESVEQLVVAHALWIEGDLDGFGVAGSVTADVAIGGVLGASGVVSQNGVDNAGNLAEGRFNAPEAAGGKSRGLSAHIPMNAVRTISGCVRPRRRRESRHRPSRDGPTADALQLEWRLRRDAGAGCNSLPC